MSSPGGNNLSNLEDDNTNIITENSDSINSFDNNLYSSGDSIGITCNASENKGFNSVTTVDLDDNDKEVSENESSWSKLPSLAVENIYTFLSRTDQSRMSLVCSRWSKDFNSPRLWKTMKFYLPEHDYSSEIYPEVRFARKYAYMFRHVEIICKRVRTHLTGVIWRQLKLFLKAMLSSSQLSSVKFINMGNYFRHLDDIIREDLFKIVVRFFNSQENLKTVIFQDSHFSKDEGLELLKAMFHSDKNTIRNLTLQGFVSEAPSMELSNQYLSNLSEVCCKISNVESLDVDYIQIFEDVINCLYEKFSSGDCQLDKNKPNISTLCIYCEDKRLSGLKGILPGTWKYLTNVFPDMKVKMDVTIHNHLYDEMEKFLVKEIPLQTLNFRFEKSPANIRTDISALFTYLQMCKYQDYLEVLNVLWMPSIDDFAESVIPFVQSCKKLQTFHIHAQYTPTEIENVLKGFLENPPASLKSITLWFNYLDEGADEDNIRALSEEYYLLFNTQGIECFLIVDPSRRLRRRERNVIVP
ncbi:F-box only protein 39-like [Argiope bruennichi]|uniref:F-box only protein 39-like n=1 Tax=Argiope bruennichi TaxID=94029 RepID=UPI0024956312|nr:F-box only protein 39-like [Argiope bruennichi]